VRTILRVAGRENALLSSSDSMLPQRSFHTSWRVQGLFATALKLRDSDGDFIAYRAWHRIRLGIVSCEPPGAKGIHSVQDEVAVVDVTRELINVTRATICHPAACGRYQSARGVW
jgi:hypothetical protein